LTGMKLNLRPMLPVTEFRQQRTTAILAGQFTPDVYMIGPHNFAPEYAKEGWIVPLEQFVENDELTDPDWEFGDFMDAALEFIKSDNVATYVLPVTAEAQILFYRADLFAEAGIEVPTTMEELHAAAVALKKDRVNGIVMRGIIDQSYWPFQGFAVSYGGNWFDDKGNITINSPESIAALDMYAKILRDGGPRGVADYGYYECTSEFAVGSAAMYLDSDVSYGNFINPEKSAIVDKFKVAPMPPGPAGFKPNTHYWAIAINAFSEKQEAAWLFMQWATSKEIQKKIMLKGVASPRKSVWADQEVLKSMPDGLAEATGKSLVEGTSLPITVYFAELEHALTIGIQEAISGQKTSEEALNDVAEKW